MNGRSLSATRIARSAWSACRVARWAVAGMVLLGSASAAWAGGGPPTPPPLGPPAPDRVYAGCELDFYTVQAIENNIEAGANLDVNVSFIVVYSVFRDNNGQTIYGDGESVLGTTGPVVCINPDEVGIEATTEDTELPDVDLLSADEALVLRYEFFDGEVTLPADRFCHTVEGNVDCVSIVVPQTF